MPVPSAMRGFFALLVFLSFAACDGTLSVDDKGPGGMVPGEPDAPGPDAPGPDAPTPDPPPPFEPAAAVMPRLTADQHRNTLEDLFGQDLPATPVEQDTNPHLFYSIGATTTTLSEHGAEQYGEAAFAISEEVFADPVRREALMGCVPASADDACARSFVESFGRRVYRRPLTGEEVGRWLALASETADGEAHRGLQMAVAGMLQSSHFLYRIELGEPDPGDASKRRYTAFEMAQRLAFLLWNSSPDDELLDAAARGELLDEASLRAQAERLLESPRARSAVQDFFSQYLDLGRLAQIDRDPVRYPGYTDSLPFAMEMELRLLVDDLVFRREGDMRDLFFARKGFVNSALADLYEVEAPGASAVSFVPVTFPEDSPRAGILTLAAFLTMNAHPTETSPTLRGKYVRERILCQSVPAPPDDVDLNLAPNNEDPTTLRERLEQHRDDPNCSGCHAFIDPPGFLFENFDSVGRFRTEVDGFGLDTSGDLDGVSLEDAGDLAQMLRADPRVPACVVKQLYRHANGRLEIDSEEAALEDLEVAFAEAGYRFKGLLIALALSEGFRTLSNEEVSP